MQTVFKYGLGRKNNICAKVNMPKDAVVLTLEYDQRTAQFAVWAIVLTDVPAEDERTFYISGTGYDLSQGLKGDETMDHINSFHVDIGPGGVQGWFHAFEVRAAGTE